MASRLTENLYLMKDFDFLAKDLSRLQQSGRLRKLVPRAVDGIHLIGPDGQRLINFGGNDYLGLAAERGRGVLGPGATPTTDC